MRVRIPLALAVPAGLLLALPATAPRAAELPPVAPAMACAALTGLDLTGLEGAPARIETAVEVRENVPRPHCAVSGMIASAIRFELRLPLEGWTQRLMTYGCGGYCGGANLDGPSPLRQSAGCAPVAAGEFALATSDMGHRRAANFFADGMWAIGNPGAVVDFAYAGMHKTTLVAKAVVRAFYGQAQRYAYFNGCSDGGRQGLMEAQRFPEDYDGVLAGAPTINVTSTNTFYHGWNARVNAGPDGRPILTARKIPALAAAVRRECGDAGGLVQDARLCALDARALACPAGEDRDDCLTPAQAEVVNKLWRSPVDDTGAAMNPGNMPHGSELAWIGSMVPREEGAAISPATASDAQWSWDFPNHMSDLAGSTGITYRNMEFTRAGFERLSRLQDLYDAANPDLRAFAARGGRLVLWHGWADSGVAPQIALNYRDAVRREMGEAAAEQVMTLYMLPGVYHCNAGPAVTNQDLLTPLMRWVEDGERPGRITLNFLAGPNDPRVARSRPVFPYPSITRYRGSGSLDSADSFEAAPLPRPVEDRTEWLGIGAHAPGRQLWCGWENGAMVCKRRGT